MADDEVTPRAGELTTANYGFTKPNIGNSDDAWGGMLNADLDSIDTTIKSVSTVANAAYPASNPSGYQTAAQVTTALAPYALTTSLASYLALSGGTMTGAMTLAADPAANLQPATKQYVDAARLGDNRIINGNFAINQRAYVSGTALPASPTVANGYGHDRWKAGAGGCTYTFTSALPDTTITITANTLTQIIEAGVIEGGVYTLSWTGTAQARVYQGTPTGSYAASPVVTASLTAGTNTIVEFNTGTVGKVKLEIGSVATLFNRQSLAKSMADCQRYYQTAQGGVTGYGLAGTNSSSFIYLITMRTTPTIVIGATIGTDANAGSPGADVISSGGFRMSVAATATAATQALRNFTANAEL